MKAIIIRIFFLLSITVLVVGVWQYFHHPHHQAEINESLDSRQVEDSEEKLLTQVNEEIEAIREVDYERAFLHLIPSMGLSGAALEERLIHEKMWLNELKIFIRFQLALDIRYYLDYVEFKHRLYQLLVREREVLHKRYGTGKDFQKNWDTLLPQMMNPYYENLENLFEKKYDETVKFNQLFNDKLMLSRRKVFKDNPVYIGL